MRVMVVHDVSHVKAALVAALETRHKVMLQTAPDAAQNEGVLQLRRMVEQGAAAFPKVDYQLVIDCGDDAAIALSALRAGYKHIRLRFAGAHEVRKTLYDEAGREKAQILSGVTEALDLGHEKDPIAAAREWLEGHD